ncbi:MAG: hypothetical protein QF394_08915 [Rhodospirillales bacterium]|nr:hypothetical protein [Rhodospirillales bacterium]
MRVDFDRRLKLEFHGSKITTDGGMFVYREPLGLTEVAVPRSLFRRILGLIDDLRRRPVPV